jgi:hypothetical protein
MGQIIKEAAMNADFVPLYLEKQGQTIHGWQLLEITLDQGDILYLTMPAMRLQQVWQNTSLTIPQSFPDLK